MAKMTRNDLKSLVKECLFEILLEASDSENLVESRNSSPKKRTTRKAPPRRPALDNISVGAQKKQPDLDVSGITSDPVMAAIFQDTAKTTLVEQAAAERLGSRSGGDGGGGDDGIGDGADAGGSDGGGGFGDDGGR